MTITDSLNQKRLSISDQLANDIKSQGFRIDDLPFPPLRKEWESFPIIKAIRLAEQRTGIEYV